MSKANTISRSTPPREGSDPDPNRPPLYAALQEHIGLKLEPSRGPVEIIVIDRAELPTAN
jgi:uncharacterized protein (TIGR03435 family)